jgi:putative sigma-54 modulation protein
MATKVDVQARNLTLAQKVEEHVVKKAGNLDHYLPAIDEARVELTHLKTARSAADRNVAQITVRGKGLTLRTEERADDILVAFDSAIEKLQHQIERYKGKHYRGRGDGRSVAEALTEPAPAEEARPPVPQIVRRKRFVVMPMNEEEAIEQMRLLGHDNFFVFYNPDTSRINVLYRRRDDTYGLIEPEIG